MLNYIQEQFTLALELAYQIYSIVKQFVSSSTVFLCCISPKRCSGTLAFPLGQQVKPQYILQDGPAIAFRWFTASCMKQVQGVILTFGPRCS